MAGKRDSSERSVSQDGNQAASKEQNIGDSMHRVLDNSVNIPTDRNEACFMASRSFKNDDAGNLNSTAQLSATKPPRNISNTGDEHHQQLQQTRQSSPNQGTSGKTSQAHQTQRAASRDQNQNVSATPASQELIGIIPPREIDTRPPDSDADGTGNYRRMAVCSETDDALCERTKMRVYMKRF